MRTFFSSCLLLLLIGNITGQNPDYNVPFEIDQQNYFSKHDIVYQTPAYEGFEGFILGKKRNF